MQGSKSRSANRFPEDLPLLSTLFLRLQPIATAQLTRNKERNLSRETNGNGNEVYQTTEQKRRKKAAQEMKILKWQFVHNSNTKHMEYKKKKKISSYSKRPACTN